MLKKLFITGVTAVGLIFSTAYCYAGTFTAFGPKTFVRGIGSPIIETASFDIKDTNTTYTLKLHSGGINSAYSRVSSAVVKLNGSTVFEEKDFNQQVSKLQRQVSVGNSNLLQVELRSIPDSGLTIILEGVDNDPPAIKITSPEDGSTVNSSTPDISVEYSDILSRIDISTAKLTIDGLNITADAIVTETGISYTPETSLKDGSHVVTATVSDKAGNETSVSSTFLVQLDKCPIVKLPLNKGPRPFIFPEPGFDAGGYEGYGIYNRAVEVADINRDGVLDMVTAANHYYGGLSEKSDLSVFIGKGDGGFEQSVRYGEVNGSYTYYSNIVLKDIDGDCFPDIALIDSRYGESSKLKIFLNDGDGRFGQEVTYDMNVSEWWNKPKILTGRFDSDGYEDIAVADSKGRIFVFKGKGGGQFSEPMDLEAVSSGDYFSVIDAISLDFNNDGIADVVETIRHWDSYVSEVVVLLGNGDGRFLEPNVLISEESESDFFFVGLTAEDLNGDGNKDILASTSGHGDYPFGLAVLMGDGNGGFLRKPDYEINLDIDYLPIRVKEFNGDGVWDVALQGYSKAYIMSGKGDGAFKYPAEVNIAGRYDLNTGDFDNDGAEDLVSAGEDHVYMLFAKGDGRFIDKKEVPFSWSYLSSDFDGDDRPDLAASYDRRLFTTILNRGNEWSPNSFQGSNEYRVGDGPVGVKIKDLNGDGRLDIISVNELSNDVTVKLNNGDGSFSELATYQVGQKPSFIAIEDLNGDGNSDIVTANYGSNDITVLLNSGDGLFQSEATYAVASNPYAVAIGDFNLDSKLDIAVTNWSSNTVSILLGSGNGSLQSQTILTVSGNPSNITKGDFNEDGVTDLAVLVYNWQTGSNIVILLGKGDGTFINKTDTYRGYNPLFTDLNMDGKMDMITFRNTATVYTGDGNGQFQQGGQFGNFTGAKAAVLGDINNDGNTDLLVSDTTSSNYENSLSIWLGQGDGTFQQGASVGEWEDVRSLDIGDINGDGIQDITLVDYKNLHVIYGSENGLFPGEAIFSEERGQYSEVSLVTADFNGDNNQDIAVYIAHDDDGQNKPKIEIFEGTGHNTFTQGSVLTTPEDVFWGKILPGDFNEDGRQDIALLEDSGAKGKVSVFLNRGDGSFGVAVSFETGNTWGTFKISDINNDGHLDIIIEGFMYTNSSGWIDYSSHLLIYAGNGDGTFRYRNTIPLLGNPNDIVVSDFNKDGFNDIAITMQRISGSDLRAEYRLEIFKNSGDGTFGEPLIYEYSFIRLNSLFAQDFDHNGTIDLAMGQSGGFSILNGNGDGTFNTTGQIYAGSPVLQEDFDIDGGTDLLGNGYLSYNLLPPLRTPPAPPKKLTGKAGDGRVSLSWAANIEEDIAGYNVYRSLSAGGGYARINNAVLSSPTYTDYTATNGTIYYYTVSAVDKDGDESSYAFKVKAIPSPPDTTPPVIKISIPTNGGTAYSPSLFVLGTINESDSKIAVNGISGTVQKNDGTFTAYGIPLIPGENTVTVTAIDPSGNISSDSIKVAYVQAASISGVVKGELTGIPVQASVYISDSEKTQSLTTGADGKYFFGKIIPGEVTMIADASNYDRLTLDKTILPGEALNLDLLMPLYPATLRGGVYNSTTYRGIAGATVTVTDRKKTQSITADSSGGYEVTNIVPYDVTITVSKPGYETYAEKMTLSNRWTNWRYYYLKQLPPTAPTGLTATAGGGYIQLSWNQSLEDLNGYNIYRSTTPGSGYTKLNSYPEYYASYKDTNVATGATYYYAITAVNTSGQESGYSAEVSAVPRDVYSPTGLTAVQGEGFVELNWSPSLDSDISGYKIYRSTASDAGYSYITTASGTYYKDKSVTGGTTYYYVVTAVDSISKESPYSNEASATPEALKLSVSITYPKDGEWLNGSRIIVRGTVETASNEAGVVVETGDSKGGAYARYLAQVNGREFAAIVTLPEGFSYIKATATDSSGNKSESPIMVSSMTSAETVKLTASPESGIMTLKTVISPYPTREDFPMPPMQIFVMDVTLEAETYLPASITSYSWDTNGDGWPEQTGTMPEIMASYYSSGIYFPTVTVMDSKGNTYTATTIVNVFDKDQIDPIFKGKWASMIDALNNGNVKTALSQISSQNQDEYQAMFSVVVEQLPSILSTIKDFTLVSISDGIAKYNLRTVKDSGLYSYEVIFTKGDDGLWKIEEF